MDPDVNKLAQLLVIIGMFSTFAVAVALAVLFVIRKWRAAPLPAREQEPRIDDSRFSRLEEAVDSIAIEVERIAEAQRFTAKLMSERLPDRLPERTSDRTNQR